MEIHVPIQPQPLFTIGGIIVTNTLLTSWIAVVVVILFALLVSRRMRLVPTGIQNFGEAIVELMLNMGEQAAGPAARRFLPLVLTLFLYIWFANWIGVALRLFGNILAGFILVEVMLQIVPIVVPAVFLGVELGVGLIQALIFAILTLAFLSIAASHGGHAEAEHH